MRDDKRGRSRPRPLGEGLLSPLLILGLTACTGVELQGSTDGNNNPDNTPDAGPSIAVDGSVTGPIETCEVDQLSPPSVYGHKVKTLLTGMPLDSAELTTLNTDPSQLSSMVQGWLTTPEFDGVIFRFFQTAFQQNQLDADAVPMMIRRNNLNWGRFQNPNENLSELMLQNFRESFARTTLELVRTNGNFSSVVTTETFQVTTAMLVFQALLEHRYANDENRLVQVAMPEVSRFTVYRNQADAPPPIEALDPSNERFLHFFVPEFERLCLPDTQNTLEVTDSAFGANDELFFIFSQMVGRPERVRAPGGNNSCQTPSGVRTTPILTRADFSDWRPVRFRKAGANEETTRFYDLAKLRTTNELVVRSDRIGFFTSLGFLATWPTNEDNQARVTLNQTLITALGHSFDGQIVDDFSPTNLDGEHSAPGTSCYGCHQTLDPMREFFLSSFSYYYGQQDNQDTMTSLDPEFVFRGTRADGSNVRDLANIIAGHADFPRAWVQKMCYFANSAPCPENSTEFQDVVRDFTASGMNFRTMLQSLMSSPLVSNAKCVSSGEENESAGSLRAISRRDQLCAQLSNRLGMDNICGQNLLRNRQSRLQRDVANAVASIPEDTFARGEPEPLIISQTGLFTRATREVVCTVVAERAYDGTFGDLTREDAIKLMVERVMGLPEVDPRHAGALKILSDHVTDGVADGARETDALRSALAVACMSPGIAGIGF